MLKLVVVDLVATTLAGQPPETGGRVLPDDGTFGAVGYELDGERWWSVPNLGCFSIDRTGGHVKLMVSSALPRENVLHAYHRVVLPMALEARGYAILHASAVHMGAGVVVLCGASGAGKSTIGYALSRRGHPQWGDDVVAIQASASAAVCLELPFTRRLLPDAMTFLEGDRVGRTPLQNGDGGEVSGRVEPLAALFILERTPSAPVPRGIRLSPADAFPRLLAHAHCLSLGDAARKEAMIRHYMTLVRLVPVFVIRFATGLNGLPAILDLIAGAVGDEAMCSTSRQICGGP